MKSLLQLLLELFGLALLLAVYVPFAIVAVVVGMIEERKQTG